MGNRFVNSAIVAVAVSLTPVPIAGQAPAARSQAYTAPRTPDGKPDLQGIWQVLNTAAWDIQDHPARLGVPAEIVLRMLLLKHLRNWSFAVVEREVRANLVAR